LRKGRKSFDFSQRVMTFEVRVLCPKKTYSPAQGLNLAKIHKLHERLGQKFTTYLFKELECLESSFNRYTLKFNLLWAWG